MLNATPILKFYSKHRCLALAKQDVCQVQEQQLFALLKKAADTRFGKEHGFAGIKSVAEFQKRVPLRSYEDFWRDYWKESFPRLENCTWPGKIPYFAVSSGTSSGTTKWIPYTPQMTRSNHKASLDLITYHLQNRPQSRLFAGRSFMLGGSTELVEQAPGIYSGDLSGIAVLTMPWWAKRRYFPPPELALLKNWEEKINRLSRESLKADIRMISGVPTWLLIFFDHLAKLLPQSEGKIGNIYPNLELLVHGGVNFAPYEKRFQELLQGSQAEMREVYPASEGFIACADLNYGEGLRMTLDHGIFFEFVPTDELESSNPTRLWVNDIECNVNYAVIMTTCAGLWAYILGDTVRFIERRPPRLLVTGRTSYYLSAFGEHLIAEEIEDAVATAAKSVQREVSEYAVGPVYPEKANELGGHLYIVEFAGKEPSPAELSQFALALDRRLCERNEDYDAHRAKGYGLKTPQIKAVKKGAFAAWMKSRGKLGGQHKVPRIITNQELFQNLNAFVEKYTPSNTG